jgi:uncharacterized protein YggU (UPF0235/DUF167 family)
MPARRGVNHTRIEITVKPGSKKTGFTLDGEAIVLRIRERPVEGAANAACIQALSEALHIAASNIALVRGTRSRTKLFAIDGLSIEEVNRLLSSPLP